MTRLTVVPLQHLHRPPHPLQALQVVVMLAAAVVIVQALQTSTWIWNLISPYHSALCPLFTLLHQLRYCKFIVLTEGKKR